MDTKLKADIAELAVTQELLRRGFKVLKPIGDRLAYDLAVDVGEKLIRLQVKAAWFNEKKKMYLVDNRRTRTNRRFMKRMRYSREDFDYAILVNLETKAFYVMPVEIFISYASSIAIVDGKTRQRRPKSSMYKDRWDLLTLRPAENSVPFSAIQRL